MDVDVWLGRLDDYLAVNAVPETRWLAILKSLVDDKIYKNLRCLGPSCSFEQAKSYLLRRYGRGEPEFALRLQFSQRVQQPAESIEDFADELRRLGTEVGKHDADQKAQFIIGLRDANAQRHLLEKVPATFDEALQIAKQFLAVQMSVDDMQRTRQRVAPAACQNNYATEGSGPSGLDKESLAALLERIEERLTRLETPREQDERRRLGNPPGDRAARRAAIRDRANATCFVCATAGHFARDCPLREGHREGSSVENPSRSAMLFEKTISDQDSVLPTVNVRLANGAVVEALIDTGAASTIVSKALVEELGIPWEPWQAGSFRSVSGHRVTPIGAATIVATCLDEEIVLNAAVLETTPFSLALGVDAMRQEHLRLEFLPESVCVSRQRTSAAQSTAEDQTQGVDSCPPSAEIRTAERCRIPPLTAAFIPVVCDSDMDQTVVEAQNAAEPGKEWAVPRCLIHRDGAMVPVVNYGKETLVWHPGKVISKGYPIEEEGAMLLSKDETTGNGGSGSEENKGPVQVPLGPRLTEEQKKQILELVENYNDVFDNGKYPMTCTAQVDHHIVTEPTPPISCKPYRTSPREREHIARQVQEMLDHDIIEPSESPWSFPVVLVKKKDGQWRFCVDYRRLNAITIRDAYPCPRVDDVLERLSSCSYFSKLDMKSAYWQVNVAPQDRPKTAFVTPDGLYQFKRMPFGLTNAPATFARLIDCVLSQQKWAYCMAYLDDVIVFSQSFQQHLERLDSVLKAVKRSGLRLNPPKCVLATHEVECLGHLVDSQGIRTDPSRVKAMADYPPPQNVKELRRFLGLCGYYRRFVRQFAMVARPLTTLLRKSVPWQWGRDEEEAFLGLKRRLTESPILRHFDDELPTEIHTDASQHGLGAVLVQRGPLGEQVVAYISRTLSKTEVRYHSNELECLAVVWALHRFRHYVHGRKFSVVTDNAAVMWLFNSKKSSGKMARWVLAAMEFLDDCTFIHRPGKTNEMADALSRTARSDEENGGGSETLTERMLCMAAPEAVSKEELGLLQLGDSFSTRMIKVLQGLDASCSADDAERIKEKYKLHDGILYQKNHGRGRPWLLVVPQRLAESICVSSHATKTAGHLGISKTLAKLRQRYFWPGMGSTCRRIVESCPVCQLRKTPQTKPAGCLQSISPPSRPFEMIGLDHLGPFPKSSKGNRHVIVCVDHLSKWVEAKAVPDTSTENVANFLLNEIVLRHGTPAKVITDRGTAFTSTKMAEVMEALGIQHGMTTAYHPQTNGLVERANRTLASILAAYVNDVHRNWDDVVPFARFAMNTAKQESTQLSPFELVHGRQAVLPEESRLPWPVEDAEAYETFRMRVEQWRRQAGDNIRRSQEKQKRHYDGRRRHGVQFQQGELVLVRRHVRKVGRSEKLMPRFIGPFQVVRRLSDVNYLVASLPSVRKRRVKSRFVVHISQLKSFHAKHAPTTGTRDECSKLEGRIVTRIDDQASSDTVG
ncbi:hypothetical protein M514_18422 [Trichuris suis]|nr:hypothetical protein M514_18422 [Trichuris suis]